MDITSAIFDPKLGCTAFTVERITYTRSRLGTIAVMKKTATDSFDSCESIGCIRGNAVVLFACRELFTCSCLILFPISRHVGNFLL